MLLQGVTKILKVLLGAFQPIASQDALTQRRIGQIGEVIGAVEDVAEDEADQDDSIAAKRVEEAHDIIHRVAAILAMEEDRNGGEGIDGEGIDGEGIDGEENDGDSGGDAEGSEAAADTGPSNDEPLQEVPWDGKLAGETINLAEEEEE